MEDPDFSDFENVREALDAINTIPYHDRSNLDTYLFTDFRSFVRVMSFSSNESELKQKIRTILTAKGLYDSFLTSYHVYISQQDYVQDLKTKKPYVYDMLKMYTSTPLHKVLNRFLYEDTRKPPLPYLYFIQNEIEKYFVRDNSQYDFGKCPCPLDLIGMLYAVILNAPKLDEPFDVYRGVSYDIERSVLQFHSRGFLSTSLIRLVAINFTEDEDGYSNGDNVYHLTLPAGTPYLNINLLSEYGPFGIYNEYQREEYEILLLPGITFEKQDEYSRVYTLTSVSRNFDVQRYQYWLIDIDERRLVQRLETFFFVQKTVHFLCPGVEDADLFGYNRHFWYYENIVEFIQSKPHFDDWKLIAQNIIDIFTSGNVTDAQLARYSEFETSIVSLFQFLFVFMEVDTSNVSKVDLYDIKHRYMLYMIRRYRAIYEPQMNNNMISPLLNHRWYGHDIDYHRTKPVQSQTSSSTLDQF